MPLSSPEMMDPALRELLDGARFYQAEVEAVAALLPPGDEELQEALAEIIAAGNFQGFLLLAAASLEGGRRVDAGHLVKLLRLVPQPWWLGNVAWKVSGDLPEALLAGLKTGPMNREVEAVAVYLGAVWCAERRGGELPPGLVAEARRLARMENLPPQAMVYVQATAMLVEDEGLLAVLHERVPHLFTADRLKKAEVAVAAFLEVCAQPLKGLMPETPSRVLAQGRPMQRAVAKLGRNDLCHCGSGKKYKRCCFEKDDERLHFSTEVAGKTLVELRAEPELGLTEPRLSRMPASEFGRIDPRKVPEALRTTYATKAAAFNFMERVAEFFEALEWNEERAAEWDFCIFYVMRAQRKDIAERLVAVHARHAPEEEVRDGVRLLLARDDPAAELQVLAETARKIFDESDPDKLSELGFGVLCSRHTELGMLICRSLIPLLPRVQASFLLQQILEARDRLELPPDDPFSDVLEKRLAEETHDEGEDAAELRAARRKLDAKAAEVRELHEKIERQRRELDRREKQPPPAAPLRAAPLDEAELREMRMKLARLTEMVNERANERIALRRELEKARDDLEAVRQRAPASAAREEDSAEEEAAHYLPETVSGNQPLRLVEYPPKFREALEELPRQTARAALAMLGRLAGGEPAAFTGVVALRACPGILRQRIGSDYRLLFRLTPDRVQVVDLINRRDLERRIKGLRER